LSRKTRADHPPAKDRSLEALIDQPDGVEAPTSKEAGVHPCSDPSNE
jgi:hypothetical protein